jgi:myo-inositol-1(or 4)-monophosphatase
VLEKVITVVKEVAQQVIMPRYLQVDRQLKSDGSFFTEADVAAQNALLHELQKIYPAETAH